MSFRSGLLNKRLGCGTDKLKSITICYSATHAKRKGSGPFQHKVGKPVTQLERVSEAEAQ